MFPTHSFEGRAGSSRLVDNSNYLRFGSVGPDPTRPDPRTVLVFPTRCCLHRFLALGQPRFVLGVPYMVESETTVKYFCLWISGTLSSLLAAPPGSNFDWYSSCTGPIYLIFRHRRRYECASWRNSMQIDERGMLKAYARSVWRHVPGGGRGTPVTTVAPVTPVALVTMACQITHMRSSVFSQAYPGF